MDGITLTHIRRIMAKKSLLIGLIIICFTSLDAQAQLDVQLWTSNGANKIQQLIEGTPADLISTGAITPWGIAVDPIAGKLFWSNATEGPFKKAILMGSKIKPCSRNWICLAVLHLIRQQIHFSGQKGV